MAKNIDVFGISLETYTVRENMQFFEEFVTTEELNIVSVVSSYMLMTASADQRLTDFIKKTDLRIIADPVIYEVVQGNYEQQYGQIKKQELEEQFLKCLIRKKKKIYFIGENEEQVRRFEIYIQEHYSDLIIAGTCGEGIEDDKVEHIINEINSADVDVLLLFFHSPSQENFIMNNKHLIHARLCVCIGDGVRSRYSLGIRISKIKGLLDQTLFKRKVMKYNLESGEN